MCVIIPSWCRIHRISLGLVYINSRSCHIIWFYRCPYTCIRIQLNVSPSLFRYLDKSICFIIPSWCRIHRISLGLVYITTRPCHIICFYRCSHTCIRIQLNVSPSLFDISRQFDVRYNPLLMPYTPHITRISLYNHQTLSYHKFLPLFIYRYKYSVYRISVAILHI
jgi:fumarate reductase subunit D